MMTTRRPRCRLLPLAPLLATACASGPAWIDAERIRLTALQQAVLDGQPLGAAYEHLDDMVLLPKRGGAVFKATDARGAWIVTPAGADGPWQRTGQLRILEDGRHAMALVQRGREVQRRVLPLP